MFSPMENSPAMMDLWKFDDGSSSPIDPWCWILPMSYKAHPPRYCCLWPIRRSQMSMYPEVMERREGSKQLGPHPLLLKKKKIAKILSIHWNPSRVKYHVIHFDVTENYSIKQLMAFLSTQALVNWCRGWAKTECCCVASSWCAEPEKPQGTVDQIQWQRLIDIWSWGTGERNCQSGKDDPKRSARVNLMTEGYRIGVRAMTTEVGPWSWRTIWRRFLHWSYTSLPWSFVLSWWMELSLEIRNEAIQIGSPSSVKN